MACPRFPLLLPSSTSPIVQQVFRPLCGRSLPRPVLLLILLLQLLSGLQPELRAQLFLSPIDTVVPMRDGQQLAVDLYLPNGPGPFPTILIQTPYNRLAYRLLGMPLEVGTDIETSPFAFAVADWRCFFGSAGACIPSPQRGEDGYDLVDWLASQSWSDGQVGTWGPSALGQIQYMTAREQPPALKAIMPMVCDPQTYYAKYYPGGILREEYLQALDGLGFGLSLFVLPLPTHNALWESTASGSLYPEQVAVPSFAVGGWFDHNQQASLRWFAGLRASSPAAVRDQHKLLMGPWAHGGFDGNGVDAGSAGELSFPEATGEADRMGRAFFEHHLLGAANGWPTEPFITYHQPGSTDGNPWRSTPAWPPADSLRVRWYLQAGSNRTDGIIGTELPEAETSMAITADPTDPSPTIGGRVLLSGLDQGPRNQAPEVEARPDALLFSTAVLAQDLDLQGPIRLHLQASTSGLDADMLVRITDVFPDGRSIGLLEGGRRIRHRNGYTSAEESLASPGSVYPIAIELPDMAYTVAAGHRLRIVVTGHNWPQFDRNLQNGGPVLSPGDSLAESLRIHSSPSAPSWIELLAADAFTATGEPMPAPSSLQLHPNPARHAVRVQAAAVPQPRGWRLFGTDGRVYASGPWPAGENAIQLPIDGLSAGSYRFALKGHLPATLVVQP